MLSAFVSSLDHVPMFALLSALLALVPLAWARSRPYPSPGLSAIALAALPLGVALTQIWIGFSALPPLIPTSKLDPRFVVLVRVGELPFSGALLTALVVGLTVALAPTLRRPALALIPGALGHLSLGLVLRAQLMAAAILPQDQKVERWVLGEPERLAVLLCTALACSVVAVRAERAEVRALALLGALPTLCWPGWLIWWMLTGLEAG